MMHRAEDASLRPTRLRIPLGDMTRHSGGDRTSVRIDTLWGHLRRVSLPARASPHQLQQLPKGHRFLAQRQLRWTHFSVVVGFRSRSTEVSPPTLIMTCRAITRRRRRAHRSAAPVGQPGLSPTRERWTGVIAHRPRAISHLFRPCAGPRRRVTKLEPDFRAQ